MVATSMTPIPAGHRDYAAVCAIARGHGAQGLGASVDGEPILACVFGDDDARHTTLVLGGIHALEWIGVEVAIALMEHIVAGPRLTDRRVIVVPLVHPDGYRLVEQDLRAGRRRYRRRNLHGVDLNRNWERATEPEVRAVLACADAEVAAGRTIDRAVSLHSFGRKLLIPWGARWRRTPHDRELRVFAETIRARLGEPYTIDQVSHWVPGMFARGMEIDQLYARYGTRAILVECTRGGIGRDPRSWITPFRWYNPPAPRAVAVDLSRALAPFVRGDV